MGLATESKPRESISHGRTRKNTEKAEAETRKKIEAEAEAETLKDTESHGKSRSRYTEGRTRLKSHARLTKAAGAKPKECEWSGCSGASPSQPLCL